MISEAGPEEPACGELAVHGGVPEGAEDGQRHACFLAQHAARGAQKRGQAPRDVPGQGCAPHPYPSSEVLALRFTVFERRSRREPGKGNEAQEVEEGLRGGKRRGQNDDETTSRRPARMRFALSV